MYTLLLLLIYMAFISLGLPDSLLGSAWPIMHEAFSVPLSYAGLVTMIISAGTICSSLMSERLTKKFGTQIVTVCSVLLTAAALFGFSTSSAFYMLCLWAIPYGLGAGAIDVALNNYVALHYSSKHMSWLHCFWGVGNNHQPVHNELCTDHLILAERLPHGIFSSDGDHNDSVCDTSGLESQQNGRTAGRAARGDWNTRCSEDQRRTTALAWNFSLTVHWNLH